MEKLKNVLNHQPVMYETNYTNLLLRPRSVFNIHLWQLLSQFGPRARCLAFPHGLPYASHSVQVCRALGTAKIQPAAWWWLGNWGIRSHQLDEQLENVGGINWMNPLGKWKNMAWNHKPIVNIFVVDWRLKMKIKHDETINQQQNFPGVGFSIRIDIRNPGGFQLHLNATDRHGISAAFPGRFWVVNHGALHLCQSTSQPMRKTII